MDEMNNSRKVGHDYNISFNASGLYLCSSFSKMHNTTKIQREKKCITDVDFMHVYT